jgi:hypothetical protein
MKLTCCLIIIIIIIILLFPGNSDQSAMIYNIVIQNGRILNPETRFDQTGVNLGIFQGKIEAITTQPLTGKKYIDATGLIVAPGFIDILSYTPFIHPGPDRPRPGPLSFR